VHQGSAESAAPIFEDLWPEARAVSDTTLDLYRAFGIGRGTPGQMFGAGVWKASLRALRKGYKQGKTQGDPWLMPGAFLVVGARVIWRHDPSHAGDGPDYGSVPWTEL
jgi:hypothetical protein